MVNPEDSDQWSKWLQALEKCLATVPKFNPVPELYEKCGSFGFLTVAMLVDDLCHPDFPNPRRAHEAAVESRKARVRLRSSLRRLAAKVEKAKPWYPTRTANLYAEAVYRMRALAALIERELQQEPEAFDWKIESTAKVVKLHAYLLTAGVHAPVETAARFIRCGYGAHKISPIPELTVESLGQRIRRFRAAHKTAYDHAFAWGEEQALADMEFEKVGTQRKST